MRKRVGILLGIVAGLVVGFLLGNRMTSVKGDASPGTGFAAIPGKVGSEDLFGPYDVVKDWPKDISTLPGNDKWTWGAGQSVFAESPNRVFLLFRGELPKLGRIQSKLLPEIGPSISFPVGGLLRDATQAAMPGAGGSGQEPDDGPRLWRGANPPYREIGVDAKWEHCFTVVDANGNIIETWDQWDKIFKRPHFVAINPYDPEKNVWVVDDHMHAIYKFTHDGKQLLQTIGTPTVKGADATHFNRPTFLAWMPDSTMFVADGYNGTRVAKFDKDGKFIKDWGKQGNRGSETRPYYWNNVHGIAFDPVSKRVFVNDRDNHRIQVFDPDGKYLYEWKIETEPSSLHLIYMGADRMIWTFDRDTQKLLKFDQQGHLLYSWGGLGSYPGSLWGVHGMSVDQEGNFYVAEVDSGRVQKFHPKPGVNPAFLVGKPIYSAWK